MSALSTFLVESKAAFLDDVATGKPLENWTICVGNEAGDLDSLASAIAYAYFATSLSRTPNERYVPLLHTARADLSLRPENLLALSSSSIPPTSLLCIDDLPSSPSSLATLGSSYVLVDHNRLLPQFGSARVRAIIDHHADEGAHPDATPRIVQVTGSCSSLVTEHFAPLLHLDASPSSSAESKSALPSSLADLLLSALLIDTFLKPTPQGKATPTDLSASSILIPHSSLSSSPFLAVSSLAKSLERTKIDVGGLGGRDLLRRDYKEYSEGTWTYGLSSVPVGLGVWASKGGEGDQGWKALEGDVSAWMLERRLDMAAVLTSFDSGSLGAKHGGPGKHARELLVCVKDARGVALFDGLGKDEMLALGEWTGTGLGTGAPNKLELEEGRRWRVWRQGNAKATRKQVAPVIKALLSRL